MHFIDRYPWLLETSTTGAWRDRILCRYEAIIEANRSDLVGARVLDIASHDARWTLAALDAGAQHVTGVEIRENLVKASHSNLARAGVPADKWEIRQCDVFAADEVFAKKFDVILCLGFFYHTTRHEMLFDLMSQTEASKIILDTTISKSASPVCEWKSEHISPDAAGHSDRGVRKNEILIAHPSVKMIELIFRHFGYEFAAYNWRSLLENKAIQSDPNVAHSATNPLGDYAAGRRGTFTAIKPAATNTTAD